MTVQDLREEKTMTFHHDPQDPAAGTSAQEDEATAPPQRVGDPRALFAARMLAAAALAVSAFIHAQVAVHYGLSGPLLGTGQLFAAQALLSSALAVAMLTRDSRVWLVAVVLSVAGLTSIFASVYFPLPSVGPLPAIDEPVWLMNKAVSAFAEASVIVLWLVRQIAPSK